MRVILASDAQPPEGDGIATVVARHTVLQPIGADRWVLCGVCPFCRSRAFRVRPHHETFHCFSCGEGGDVPAFLAKINDNH